MSDRPTVPEVVPLVDAYYAKPGNSVGGSLHTVLDDGNLRDSHIAYCRETAEKNGDSAGVHIANLLLQMSMTQRRKVYRGHR